MAVNEPAMEGGAKKFDDLKKLRGSKDEAEIKDLIPMPEAERARYRQDARSLTPMSAL
jgi:hypothetical protein